MPNEEAAAFRRLVCGAFLALVFAALLNYPRLSRPIERSLASASTTYMVLFFRNWDDVGFKTLRGIPTVGSAGSDPVTREAYLHHPVLAYWAIYGCRVLFGWTETAFRILPFTATVLAAFLTVFLAGRYADPLSATLAGLLYPLCTMVYAFGLMPNTDPIVVPVILMILLVHAPARRGSLLATAALVLLLFAGALIEWQLSFVVPAILVSELLRPKAERRFREFWILSLTVGLAWALLVGYFLLAVSDSALVFDELTTAGGHAIGGHPESNFAGFLSNQLKTWRQFMGWPLLLMSLGLLAAVLLRPRLLKTESGRAVVVAAIPGLLTILLFRAPAFDHDFFWMPLLVAVPLAFAILVSHAWTRAPALGALFVISTFASSAWLDLEHEQRTSGDHFRQLGAMVNVVAGPRDLVMTPEGEGPANFYLRARMIGSIRGPELLELALERRRKKTADFDRLFVWMYPWTAEQGDPKLIEWLNRRATRLHYQGVLGWIVNDPE